LSIPGQNLSQQPISAGAHDVIASLWGVDDESTAALMTIFYRKMWNDGQPPIGALREAQLFLYRNPDRIGDLASSRGLGVGREVTLAKGPAAPKGRRSATKVWAGFVLSGAGRES
jgi:CHAT domain-containing protein